MTPRTEEKEVADKPFTMSLRTMIALVSTVVILSAGATGQYLSLRYSIENNKSEIMLRIASLETSITGLQAQLKQATDDQWRGHDMLRYAYAYKSLNTNSIVPDPVILRDQSRVEIIK